MNSAITIRMQQTLKKALSKSTEGLLGPPRWGFTQSDWSALDECSVIVCFCLLVDKHLLWTWSINWLWSHINVNDMYVYVSYRGSPHLSVCLCCSYFVLLGEFPPFFPLCMHCMPVNLPVTWLTFPQDPSMTWVMFSVWVTFRPSNIILETEVLSKHDYKDKYLANCTFTNNKLLSPHQATVLSCPMCIVLVNTAISPATGFYILITVIPRPFVQLETKKLGTKFLGKYRVWPFCPYTGYYGRKVHTQARVRSAASHQHTQRTQIAGRGRHKRTFSAEYLCFDTMCQSVSTIMWQMSIFLRALCQGNHREWENLPKGSLNMTVTTVTTTKERVNLNRVRSKCCTSYYANTFL